MCNECYSKGCHCNCIFEDIPEEGNVRCIEKKCMSCDHTRELYGDYDADEYDRTKGDRF